MNPKGIIGSARIPSAASLLPSADQETEAQMRPSEAQMSSLLVIAVDVQVTPELVEVKTVPEPHPLAAANLVPSAELATQRQFWAFVKAT